MVDNKVYCIKLQGIHGIHCPYIVDCSVKLLQIQYVYCSPNGTWNKKIIQVSTSVNKFTQKDMQLLLQFQNKNLARIRCAQYMKDVETQYCVHVGGCILIRPQRKTSIILWNN